MSRFKKRIGYTDSGEMESVCRCPECGQTYSGTGGGHCRGGEYGGCCRTFTSDTSASAHRRGPGEARRCITSDEMAEEGWRFTDNGWTNSAPLPEDIYRG